ncbi:MAG: SusD/RagB family nutrient-binding outer membrane lipoprotein [Cyclobacteriaceae bacterium]
MKNINRITVILTLFMLASCNEQFDQLQVNPNVASDKSAVPPSYILGRLLFEVYNGGGTTDGRAGNVFEGPWDQLSRWSQYTTSNNNNYGGSNFYTWSSSATMYNFLKNITVMEEQAFKSLGTKSNAYAAMGKFLKAYSFIWLTQRVGDIPMTEAGLGLENLTPKFDSQKDVYAKCLQLLEEANAELTELIPKVTSSTNIDGDIYFANDLKKWQQVINTYKLRVLISLSKRADDTPDLGIKQKFADVINNPTKYPIFKSNSDNMSFKYNSAFNQYPTFYITLYADQLNISNTLLNLLTPVKDPRTFITSTPAPAQIKAGKTISDFTAYVGAANSVPQTVLVGEAGSGKYSYANYIRYLNANVIVTAPEPYVIVGYPEMCFNIAEAINRGWITGNAATYYTNGIKASLSFYGLVDGTVLPVGDAFGKPYGNVTVSVTNFLNDVGVVYAGDNVTGLTQILQQKFVALFQSSGWEPFYNQRRTGIPTYSEGVGTNGSSKIPKRWTYPADERNNNPVNANDAIQRQFGGTDDLNALMWLLK